jgi:hypothetical protein
MAAANPHGHDHEPVKLERAPQTRPPGEGEEHRRRRQALVASLAGAVIGAAIGVAAVAVVNPHQSAYRGGVVFACALIGLFAGGILSETRVAEDVDAPVRDVEARRRGESATSEQGQLPGSPVRPMGTDEAPEEEPPR